MKDFYAKVNIWDIVKLKVLINKEKFWDYIYWVVEESDEVLSWVIINKQFSYLDIDNITNEEPEIVWNIKEYPNFKQNWYKINL